MSQNNDALIILMFIFQIINVYLLFGEYGKQWVEKKSRVFFIILPTLVILSILWRPL
jgi:hypothetical protein